MVECSLAERSATITFPASMRRTPLTRALAAMMAVWLAVVLGEPAALHHHCPMHDGPAPAAMAHGGHAEHHAPAPEHGSHACTCLGTCSAGGTAAVPASAPAILASTAWSTAPAPRDRRPLILPRRAFALPFANGPPVSLRA